MATPEKNGEIINVTISATPIMYGDTPAIISLIQDITERKLSDEKLQKSEARMRAILDNVPYLIWLKDTDGRFIAVNEAFFKITGLATPQEVLGKTDFDLWPEELANKYRADDVEVTSTRKQKLSEDVHIENGEAHWVETFKAPIMDAHGQPLGTTGFAQDITVRKNAEGKIRHLAHYDTLTDLPNRTLFSDRLQQALSTSKRDKTRMALMFLDLDKFKPINDEYGHHVGDLLLQEAAKRMQDCVRESDTVARIGGDEFVVLLPIIESQQDALLVAEKIRTALNQPFVIVGHSLNISSSTGIAIYPEHGINENTLFKNVDSAMYYAKENGRNDVAIYRPEMP
ncbi:MAG: diguanylate cyclase [Gallionellaceae bacterium]